MEVARAFDRGSDRTIDIDHPDLPDNNDKAAAPGSVPLFTSDIKVLRIEKKGIGGYTNAPDSVYDIPLDVIPLIPGLKVPTPADVVATYQIRSRGCKAAEQ